MNRKTVIISNPGEPGGENYCGGVIKDVVNYRSFLLSPIGGLWRDSEIIEMSRPSVAELRLNLKSLSDLDYVLMIFAGHGWHSTNLDCTVLQLKKGQEIDSTELRIPTRETLILDCCRLQHPGIPEDRALLEKLAKAAPPVHGENCRRFYDQQIQRSANELIVLYACSKGQSAADDSQKGGIFTHNLLGASEAWARNSTAGTSHEVEILSVVSAYDRTAPIVERLRGGRQTPHIEKPRTGPYYPFCIVA